MQITRICTFDPCRFYVIKRCFLSTLLCMSHVCDRFCFREVKQSQNWLQPYQPGTDLSLTGCQLSSHPTTRIDGNINNVDCSTNGYSLLNYVGHETMYLYTTLFKISTKYKNTNEVQDLLCAEKGDHCGVGPQSTSGRLSLTIHNKDLNESYSI